MLNLLSSIKSLYIKIKVLSFYYSLGGVHASRFTPSLVPWFALRNALLVVKLLQLVHDYRI